MSFYNQLKTTQACGTFQNSDYPGGGLQANAIFDRNVTVSQNLTVTGTTSLGTLLPIPSVAVNNTATLPASTSNEVFIVCTGTTTYTVTLPAPVTGYTLWVLNQNTSAVTLAAPTNNTLIYENPIGTFNTGTTVSMISHATLGLFSDGTLWYVFYNSGLVSQLSSGIATLAYLSYNSGSNAVEDSINMIVDGTLKVNTGPLNFPAASVANASLATGKLTDNNTWSGTNAFSNGINVTAGTVAFPAASVANAALATGKLTDNNSWSGTNTFTNNVIANSQTITPTQLGYLSGATSNLQTQLNVLGFNGPCALVAAGNAGQYFNIGTLSTVTLGGGIFIRIFAGIPYDATSNVVYGIYELRAFWNLDSPYLVSTYHWYGPATATQLLSNILWIENTSTNFTLYFKNTSTHSLYGVTAEVAGGTWATSLTPTGSTSAPSGTTITPVNQYLLNSLITCSAGFTVSAGAITVPGASIANAALTTGKLTDNNSFSGTNAFTNGIAVSGAAGTFANGLTVSSGTTTLGTTTSDTVLLNADISANSQTITPTQLGYVSGATSNLQTQITNLANSISGTISYGWVFYNGTNYTLSFGVNVTGVTNASNVVTVETTFSGNNAVAGIANAQQNGILVQGAWSQRTPTVKWAFTLLNSTTATAQNSSFAFLIIAY